MKDEKMTKKQMIEKALDLFPRFNLLNNSSQDSHQGKITKESESLYRFIADSIDDVITVQDIDYKILFVNNAIRRITEWTPEEMLGKTPFDEIHHDDRLRLLQAYSVAKNGAESTIVDWRVHHKSGTFIWMESHIIAVRNENHAPCYFISTSRDISVRKHFEDVLQQSEERFRVLIEKAPIGISILHKGKLIFFNEEARKIWGYEAQDNITGRPLEDFIAESFRKEATSIHKKRISGLPISNSYEALGVRKDGTEFPFQIDIAVIHMLEGPSTIQFFRDISENKVAEDALRDSAERLKLAFQADKDGFLDWNIETGNVEYSEIYEDMLGFTKEELDNHFRAWNDRLVHPEDKAAVLKMLRDHLTGKTDVFEVDQRVLKKSGGYRWIHIRARVCMWDSNGKPLRMVGTYSDVSARKRLEEELRSAKELLEKEVEERTIDLQEANTTMKVLLKQQEIEKNDLGNALLANVLGKVMPHINQLKGAGLKGTQMVVVDRLEEDLRAIMSPFMKNLKVDRYSFTARELQISDLIRCGKTSKEIAEQLNLSVRTVDLVRYRIRKKLNINNKNINLEEHLSQI